MPKPSAGPSRPGSTHEPGPLPDATVESGPRRSAPHRRPAAHPFTRRDRARRALHAWIRTDRRASLADALRGVGAFAPQLRRHAAAITVAVVVIGATLGSVATASGARPSAAAAAPSARLVAGGDVLSGGPAPSSALLGSATGPDTAAGSAAEDGVAPRPTAPVVVADPRAQFDTYRVGPGDTLYTIAARSGLSFATLMWANGLSGTVLHVGQILLIPPADGTLIKVAAGETLASIAARTGVDEATISAENQLVDGDVVVGQTLFIPGGAGPSVHAAVSGTPAPTTGRTPAASALRLVWPVPGGRLSQGFGCTGVVYEPPLGSCRHYHSALDIAAPWGTPVVAAAAGTVVFAGWRNNGGGFQVWISHGGGYYTGYYHMSSVAVHAGQNVARRQRIGRVGMTGNATGPHTHFELWIGPMWGNGHRVDPRRYM